MKRKVTLISSLGAALLASSVAVAQEEADIVAKVTASQTDDIDFDTTAASLGLRAITSYGLIQCDLSRDSGETRIDTFDDVFGAAHVTAKPWNDFEADKIQCGYGLRLPLLGGELTSGIGMLQYDGETDTTDDGKEITVDAISFKARFERGHYSTELNYSEKEYSFLYHHLALNYDSDTRGKVRTTDLIGNWGPLLIEAEYIDGNKERIFTTPLFPYAPFDYDQTTVSVGPRFKTSTGPLRYIAATYVTGSEAGSYSALEIDEGVRGVVLDLELSNINLRLDYLDTDSAGTRDYTPVTNDLAESSEKRTLALELTAKEWSLKLENNESRHDGFITVSNIIAPPVVLPYATLVGCASSPCSYNNYREEEEWVLSGTYDYSQTVTLQASLYQRSREDKQYENPTHDYSESGGTISIAVSF